MKKPVVLGKRQPLGVQAETITKVAAKIAAAESAITQEYEIRQVPLADIQFWDDQPRTFLLKLEDVYRGEILINDALYKEKIEELDGIIALAMSQKEFGILNPPLAYALPGKKVQLMGGQRRTMAAIYALFHLQTSLDEDDNAYHEIIVNSDPDLSCLEKERIAVKVFFKKPNDLTLERLGIVDNVQRTELPIGDKLKWLLKFAEQREGKGGEIRWRDLVDTLGLSRSQAYEWLAVVQSRHNEYVKKIIEKVFLGTATFSRLLEIAKADSALRELMFNKWYGTRPVPDAPAPISLGKTANLNALRTLVLANVEGDIKQRFASIDWGNPKIVKKGFAEFLEYWESKHG